MDDHLQRRLSARGVGADTGVGWRGALVFVFNVLSLFHYGSHARLFEGRGLEVVQAVMLVVIAGGLLFGPLRRAWSGAGAPDGETWLGRTPARVIVETVLVALGLALCWWWAGLTVAGVLLLIHHLMGLATFLLDRSPNPGLVFVGSFVALIAAGTGALMLPAATPADDPISLVDAVFTSTSAVCVTGLIVRDTPTEFTRFGQAVILVLIQLGGLGIVLFSVLLAVMLGSRFSLRATHALADATMPVDSRRSLSGMLLFVGGSVVLIESIGALALFFGWPGEWAAANGFGGGEDRAFNAVFFSVSAFCNAGFATTSDSLAGLRGHWTTHGVIAPLIVLGGIGFPVLAGLWHVGRHRLRGRRVVDGELVRLSLHAKLVITTTICLYVSGVVLLWVARTVQGNEPALQALGDAHFMSVSARTAGFDTVPPASLSPPARFVLIFLMFIGGSPGSTAGGVKTIATAAIALTIWSTVRGRSVTTAFGRTLSEAMVRKAAVLLVLGLATIATLVGTLVFTESELLGAEDAEIQFEHIVFESVSACSTVGLSMGVTGQLSDAGRVAVSAGMLLGRVGPLAFLVALVRIGAGGEDRWSYPSESVMMG